MSRLLRHFPSKQSLCRQLSTATLRSPDPDDDSDDTECDTTNSNNLADLHGPPRRSTSFTKSKPKLSVAIPRRISSGRTRGDVLKQQQQQPPQTIKQQQQQQLSPLPLSLPQLHSTPTSRAVRIFLEVLPLPNRPDIRTGYPLPPHAPPLLLDLDDPPEIFARTVFSQLDPAARQTLMYADELLFRPLTKHGVEEEAATTTATWDGEYLRDLAGGFLGMEKGWEVVYRCEVMPWAGWFSLGKGDEMRGLRELLLGFWEKGKECGGGADDDNDDDDDDHDDEGGKKGKKTKTKTKKKKKRKRKGEIGEDEEWVCFSRRKGVLRVDLLAKFVYRTFSHS